MSDGHIVEKFFRSNEIQKPEKFLVDDQWQFLTEGSGGGAAITNTLYFDTLSMQSQMVDWESAYLALPIRLASSTGSHDYTLDPTVTKLALKASVLSLIYSCVLSTGSGQQMVSDTNLHLINNLRLVIDHSENWMKSEAVELCYAKDTANSADTAVNAGALARSTYMMQQSNLVTVGGNLSEIHFNAIIPLRMIQPVFAAMGTQLNTHYSIQYGLNFQNGSASIVNGFSPFTVFTGTDAPRISIGNNVLPTPRIYYRCLKMAPEYMEKLSTTYAKDFTKKISFSVTDISPWNAAADRIPATVGTAVNKLVSPNTVRPQRLWVLPLQTLALASQSLPALFECPGVLNNIQVTINNESYFKNPLQTQYECWQEVLRCMPGYTINEQEGNQINFGDFMGPATPPTLAGGAYHYYIFDISRVKDRIRSPNDAVSIQFSAQKADALAVSDVYYLVEREQHIAFDFVGGAPRYKTGIIS